MAVQGPIGCARMQIMERQYLIVGSNGELENPAAIRESLGIVDGTRLCFQQDGARIIVEVDRAAAMESNTDE